jgi:hypothetical protein
MSIAAGDVRPGVDRRQSVGLGPSQSYRASEDDVHNRPLGKSGIPMRGLWVQRLHDFVYEFLSYLWDYRC